MPDLSKLPQSVEAEYKEQVHSIYRFYHDTLPFTAEFVRAFNAWEMGDHLEQVSHMQTRPDTYGTWAEIEHLCPPPVPVRGIVWTDDGYVAISD
jgi:phospholipase/lecithinase/hemolysin